MPLRVTAQEKKQATRKRGGLVVRDSNGQGGTSPQIIVPTRDSSVVEEILKDIAKPFARTGVSTFNLFKTLRSGGEEDIAQPRDLPFLGKTRPAFTGKERTGEAAKKILGFGSDIGSTLAGGGGGAQVIKQSLKGLAKQGLKTGTKTGLVVGSASMGGRAAQENKSLGEIAADIGIGGLIGGVGGGILGAGFPLVGKGLGFVLKQPLKLIGKIKKPTGETVLPIVRDIAKPTAKAKTKPAVKLRMEGLEKRINEQMKKTVDSENKILSTPQTNLSLPKTPQLVTKRISNLEKTLGKFAKEKSGIMKKLETKSIFDKQLNDLVKLEQKLLAGSRARLKLFSPSGNLISVNKLRKNKITFAKQQKEIDKKLAAFERKTTKEINERQSKLRKKLVMLNGNIRKTENRIEDIFSQEQFRKSKKLLSNVTGFGKQKRLIEKEAKKQESKLLKLEKIRKERIKTAIKGVNIGDEIFSKDKGRFKVKSFLLDSTGEFNVLGKDVNGRILSLSADDLQGMKKLIKPQQQVREFLDLPNAPRFAADPSKKEKIIQGLRGWTNSVRTQLGKLGDGGKKMSKMIDTVVENTDRAIGRGEVAMLRGLKSLGLDNKGKNLDQSELKNIVSALDSGLRLRVNNPKRLPGYANMNDREKGFTKLFFSITKPLIDKARNQGLKIKNKANGKEKDIGEALVHFPHILKDKNKFLKNREDLVNLMVDKNQLTPKQANSVLNNFVKNFGKESYAGIENARTFQIEGFDNLEKYGFETNPVTALKSFIGGISKRLEEAKVFGKNNEIMSEVVNRIKLEGRDSGMAQEIWNRYRGNKELAVAGKQLSLALRTAQIVGKLALGAITNLGQTVNPVTEFGALNFIKGLKNFVTKEGRETIQEKAMLAGVTDDVVRRIEQLAGAEGKIAETALQKFGFSSIERFNRRSTVAAVQGWVESSLKSLIRNPKQATLRRHFNRLGINESQLKTAIANGKFSQEKLNIIGQKAVKSTQFRGGVLDIPLFWTSPHGKVFTQFKSFAFQQGDFIKREIIDELRQGNATPLITYLVASQVIGEPLEDVKALLSSRERPEDVLERMIDNQLGVGGIGLYGGLLQQMDSRWNSKDAATEFLVGPTGSQIAEVVGAMFDLVFEGKTKPAVKAGLRVLPAAQTIPGAPPGTGPALDIIRRQIQKNL